MIKHRCEAGTGGPWNRLSTITHARPSAAPKWQPFVSWSGSVLRGWGLARTLPAQGAQRGCSGLTGAAAQAAGVLLPRPDGGCQKTDATLTKGAVDGRLSSAGEAGSAGRETEGGQWQGWLGQGRAEGTGRPEPAPSSAGSRFPSHGPDQHPGGFH